VPVTDTARPQDLCRRSGPPLSSTPSPTCSDGTRIELGELGPSAAVIGATTLPVARLRADGGRKRIRSTVG
jgi:hypothetical protein